MVKQDNVVTDEYGFSEEENRIYNESIKKIKEDIDSGLGLDEVRETLSIENEEFKKLIIDDFLKITIAGMHFNHKRSMEEVAEKLKISVERVTKTRQEMLEEVKEASIRAYYKEMEGKAHCSTKLPE